jgi:putative transposase
MPRRLRIEYPGAIHHVMARGNGRQDIVRDDRDRQHWLQVLERTVAVLRWELFAFVLMSNHFHLFLRTPQPNLSRGMQRLLSGYAIWWARRHRRSGHLFQGRFRAQLIEDESYFWTVSRYLHLNPVRAKLVEHPQDWPWSSYPGYSSMRRRLDWVAYDALLAALQGEYGGSDPSGAYRRYVTVGLKEPVASPFDAAWQGLVVGSPEFLRDVKSRLTATPTTSRAALIAPQRLAPLDRQTVYAIVLRYYDRPAESLETCGSRDWTRAVTAYLARRWSDATLVELARDLGLSRPDCVPNLTRRVERGRGTSAQLQADLHAIEDLL